MLNIKKLLDQVMSANQTELADTASSLAGYFLKKPAMLGGALAGGGGLLAALMSGGFGGVEELGNAALKAYNNWRAKNSKAASSPQSTALDFGTLPAAIQEEHSRAILSAMVAAAKADSVFDEHERRLILEETRKAGDTAITAWVQQEINKPLDVDAVAHLATTPEMVTEIYLASLLVIDEQNVVEKNYLDLLATKMNLNPQLREELEKTRCNV